MHWSKQIYLSLLPFYPTASLVVNGFRGDSYWARLYTDKTNYELKEEDADMFEEELIKVNDTLDIPFEDIKITISTTNKVSDEVYGITGFRYGADYVFPVRMLVRSSEEFRNHINEIISGATGLDFDQSNAKLISEKEIQGTVLSEAARRFLFRRSICQSTSYQMFITRYAIWGGCTAGCYGIFALLFKFAGPFVALAVSIPATIALFYFAFRASIAPQDLELDRRIYTIDDSYVEGCKQFLTACINFGVLMNRVNKQARSRAFTIDGNPNDGHAAYTTRMELLKAHIEEKAREEKAKKLRQL